MGEFARNRAVPFAVHTTAAAAKECARTAAFYEKMVTEPASFPCSFALDGVQYKGFGETFAAVSRKTVTEELKVTDTLTFRHTSGLTVIAVCALYPQHAACEWTLWFKNEPVGWLSKSRA